LEFMKVLYFHQYFVTPHGAGGVRSYMMARKLIERGHQVTMVCGRTKGGNSGLSTPFIKGRRRGVVDGIDVIEFDLAYSNYDGFATRIYTFLKYARRSVGLALTERYDILFSTTTPLTAGIPGIFARWIRYKPFVFEVRDLWPELPRAMGVIRNPFLLWAMGVLEWLSYRSANSLIGLSPGIVKGITRRGVSSESITLVPNGCDLDLFSSEAEPWRPTEVPVENLMAVFSGTHGIANGLDKLIDAAVELNERGRNDISIVLIGDGKLKQLLQKRVKQEGLNNVIFHDPVNKARLAGLFASADIGLQILANVPAFYYGTSPNKFFDYIAAGLPVLNNYPGWLADMINEHECGFSVPPDNPYAFADALEIAADNRHILLALGRRSRELAESQFSREHLSDLWVNFVIEAKK
jgi:glycosyltransferase involved in cell wall biosynthesis